MFLADLYRLGELQDVVEVEVLRKSDEQFLKRERIKVVIEDRIFGIVLIASNPIGTTVEYSKKLNESMTDAFSTLVKNWGKTLSLKMLH